MHSSDKVLVECRPNASSWLHGLPVGPGSSWPGPMVVVMSPLIVRPEWQSCLDEINLARLDRVQDSGAWAAKLAAHALLRLVLARVDGALPHQHSLRRDRLGRPHPVRLPDWSCSLSHDSSGVAVAVGAAAEPSDWLGVDICRPLPDRTGLDFVLHDAEKRLLDSDPASSDRLLARCWASKESLLKRWGWGMIPGLDRICTVPGLSHVRSFTAPQDAEPASSSAITSRLLDDGPAIAIAHRPDQVPTWWRASAVELDAALLGP